MLQLAEALRVIIKTIFITQVKASLGFWQMPIWGYFNKVVTRKFFLEISSVMLIRIPTI